MRLYPTLFLLMAIAGAATSPALGACTGRLEGEFRAGGGEYDPFDALDFRRRQSVTVRNTGTEICNFVVGYHRQPAEGSLIWFLKYRLENSDGLSLLSDQAPSSSGGRYLILSNLAPSQTATIDYYLVLPRGQFAFPGTFHDNEVTLSLHHQSSPGVISPVQDDEKTLSVSQTVKASLRINIAGGGLSTTLNFGELTQGKEGSVAINTKGNYAYSLNLRSENSGFMRLESGTAEQNWTIPYTLRVNGQVVSLEAPARLRRSVSYRASGEASHLLAFRIGEVRDRMAGLYRDVIAVEIKVEP